MSSCLYPNNGVGWFGGWRVALAAVIIIIVALFILFSGGTFF